MNINYNKIHGCHHFHHQVQTLHDFIDCVVGPLSSADHHRALSYRAVRDPIFKLVDHEGNTLIHQVIQIGRVTGHLCHHSNLKKRHSMTILFSTPPHKQTRFSTHRQLVIKTAVAVVTGRGSWGVQTEHHLIPVFKFAQAFRETHD